ncbi:Tat (twin-arginine translocation) pathway signal sequence [Cytobacillus depressus]|uniref:Tat (Twin-arginine translocation) pathway signal sequence n=2 Tax=Cytobacillus depressus TaxID=1602942 RepID=A0A6L3V704_9BACI|nr:Tat (twin-arginine translocation) pathway signal sequence [Cytobacillus depressus]
MSFVVVMFFVSALLSSQANAADTIPGGPSTNGNTSMDSMITYDDMIKELKKIEHASNGKVEVFTLDEYGKSEQNRSFYVAKVGTGPIKIWVQAQIHGDEKLTTDAVLELLKTFGSNGSKDIEKILKETTIYAIPMYNPDGSIMNTRTTLLHDEKGQPRVDNRGRAMTIDLNRDWAENGFQAKESLVFYKYWADLKPDFAVDLHHQGFKTVYGTNESTSMSLGVSLAPNGPTLPSIKNGLYNDLTRQMHVYVYDALKDYGYMHIDRYQTGSGDKRYEIDIKGGVVSAMMLGLNYNNINPTNHSNPAIFFETKGNTRDGNLGQKSNGHLIKQNYLGLKALLYGLATGEVEKVNPNRWDEEIPVYPLAGYQTDTGIIPVSY